MTNQTIRFISTFFYIGYLPVAPGTIASLVGALIYIIFQSSPAVYVGLFIIIAVLGFFVSASMEKLAKEKDPTCIVIDEVAGALLAFFFLPINWKIFLTAFFLFRAFDMFKIYPEKLISKDHSSFHVMGDDLFAGLLTNITMHVAIKMQVFI